MVMMPSTLRVTVLLLLGTCIANGFMTSYLALQHEDTP